MKRELVVLGVVGVALLAILPFSAEANPEYEATQGFLDDMAAATASIQKGDLAASDVATRTPGLRGTTAVLNDGSTGTVLVGFHTGRCFLIHWQTPGASGPRAGVLDPALGCDTSARLTDTLPSPPLVEVFPGTVPPLEAEQLLTRIGEARHGAVEPFPAERTAAWFMPVVAFLLGIAFWELAGITLKLLRRHRRFGAL